MLRFIYGRIGSGKTGYIYREISDMINSGSDNIILIVPEQYTFATEKELLNIIPPVLFDKIKIVSFTRLASQYQKKSYRKKLDNGSKAMLMNIAVNANEDKLDIYKGHKKSLSVIEDMLNLLSDLKKSGYATEQLRDLSLRTDGILKKKLSEASDIILTYEALIADDYIDTDSELDDLYEVLCEKNIFCGKEIYIDAFHGFFGQELKIIEKLLQQANNVTITVTTDCLYNKSDDFGPFAYSKEAVADVLNLAKKSSVKIAEPVFCEIKGFYAYRELRALEENIFRQAHEKFEGGISGVSIYEADNIREECEAAAQEIKKLIRLNNYRCRDITVITRDLQSYGEEIEYQLSKYGIPHFRDERASVFSQPLIQLVTLALSMAVNGFTVEALMGYLKTQLAGISTEEISEFENYILMWKISGNRFKKPFTMHPDGYGFEFSEDDYLRLEKINETREKAVEPLAEMFELLKNPDGKTAATAIYGLLSRIEASGNLKNLAIALEYGGDEFTASEQSRIWDELIKIIDNFYYILSNTRLTKKRVYELFVASVKNIDIGNIPRGLDEISIGDAARIRIDAPKAVFILGANDGVFPKRENINSAFSEKERKKITELGCKIGSSEEYYYKSERFFAYYASCCATDRLFVSFSRYNLNGEAMFPSEIVTEIEKILPDIKRITYSDRNILDFCEGIKPAFELAAEKINENSDLSVTLKKAFEDFESYNRQLERLRESNRKSEYEISDSQTALDLFGKNMYTSASKCEVYSLCPFQYFLKYGINAKKRKTAELDPLQKGTLIHKIFEAILGDLSISEFVCLSDEALSKKIETVMSEYFIKKMGGDENTKRFQFLFNRYRKTALILLQKIQKEFSKSDFVPVGFEVKIANDGEIKPYEIPLENGGVLRLVGSVDRVDMYENNGEKYIRVVDYKTGTKDFNLSDVLYGLNMQMLLYLFAIEKNGEGKYEKTIPCGVLYYNAGVSILKADKEGADLSEIRKGDNRLQGILLNNSSVLEAMENRIEGEFIPVKLDKNDKLTGQLISAESFGNIARRLENILYEMANNLQNGVIPAFPVNGKNYDKTCEFCDYHSVCGHTLTDKFREINTLKLDEVEKILGGDTDAMD